MMNQHHFPELSLSARKDYAHEVRPLVCLPRLRCCHVGFEPEQQGYHGIEATLKLGLDDNCVDITVSNSC